MNEQCLCHSRSNSNVWRRPQSSYQRTVVKCPTLGPLVRSCLVRGMLLVYIRLWQQRQCDMYGLWLVPSRTLKGSQVTSRTLKGSEVLSRTLKGSQVPSRTLKGSEVPSRTLKRLRGSEQNVKKAPASLVQLTRSSLRRCLQSSAFCPGVVCCAAVVRWSFCPLRGALFSWSVAGFFSVALLARFRARLLAFCWKECPKPTVKERNAFQNRKKFPGGSLGTQDPERCPHVDGHQP